MAALLFLRRYCSFRIVVPMDLILYIFIFMLSEYILIVN